MRFGRSLSVKLARRFRSSFRGKFARRIGVLFILCVLLPIAMVGAYSIKEVSDQLRAQSDKRLRRTSKALGIATFERLGHLGSELAIQARRVRDGAPPEGNMRHFRTIHVLPAPSDGEPDPGWPRWTDSQRTEMGRGQPVIGIAAREDRSAAVCMALSVEPGRADSAILVAEISPGFLWRPMGVSDTIAYWVLDSHRQVLFLSPPPHPPGVTELALSPTAGIPSGDKTNFHGERELATRSWDLFLKARFHTSSWTFVACEDRSEVLTPYMGFKRNLMLGVFLAFLFVCLITLTQVRRSLVPLTRLWVGTKRIAAGRFGTHVTVKSNDEFRELAHSFNDMAEQLGRQFRSLSARADIDQALLSLRDLEQLADTIGSRISAVVPSRATMVILCESQDRTRSFAYETETAQPIPSAESSMSELTQLLDGAGTLTVELQGKPARLWAPVAARMPGTLHLMPAVVDGRIEGAIGVVRSEADPLPTEDEDELRRIAAQISVGLSKARVFRELEELHWGTLTALARTIDAKSPWTAGHSERVTRTALAIARKLGLSEREQESLRRGALLHDIGKIGVPQTLLDAARQLTEEEMEVMRQHPQQGARILEPIPAFRDALQVVTQHHERFDGTGYPLGLKGDHIALTARILSVADTLDALVADRPYRRGMSREVAIEEIRRNSGTQFDPDVVAAFIQLCREENRPGPIRSDPSPVLA